LLSKGEKQRPNLQRGVPHASKVSYKGEARKKITSRNSAERAQEMTGLARVWLTRGKEEKKAGGERSRKGELL